MRLLDRETTLERRLLLMRIIHLALLSGCTAFLVVAVVLRMQGQMQPAANPPMLSFVCGGVGVIQFLLALFLPDRVLAGWRRRLARSSESGDLLEWVPAFQNRLLLRLSLLESGAFTLLLAYLIEGLTWSLGGGLAFLLVLLLQFPTRHGIESWVEEQKRKALQEP